MDRIVKTPGVCGGDACVRDTRIAVWMVVEALQLGIASTVIPACWPGLIREDIDAVLDYFQANPKEIFEAIQNNQAFVEEGFLNTRRSMMGDEDVRGNLDY